MKLSHILLWAAALIAWSIGLTVNGATVTGTIRARDGSTMKTWINFAVPSSQRPVVGSNDLRPGWTLSTNSAANGTFRVVLYQGDYTVQVGNDTLDKFNILVPSGTATYDISQLTTNAVTPLTIVSAWVPSTNGSAYSLKLPAAGAASGRVWTCTNSVTGAGHWAVATGGSGGSLFEADDDSNLMPIEGTSIVPRADNEGGLGTEAKRWQSANVVTGQLSSLKVGSFTTTNLYNPADATNHVTLATNSLNTVLRENITNHVALATNDLNVVLRTALTNHVGLATNDLAGTVAKLATNNAFTGTSNHFAGNLDLGANVNVRTNAYVTNAVVTPQVLITTSPIDVNATAAVVLYYDAGSDSLIVSNKFNGQTWSFNRSDTNAVAIKSELNALGTGVTNHVQAATNGFFTGSSVTNAAAYQSLLATNDLNTALWTTIRNATNPPGNPLLPASGTLYAFGDSQTAGYNYSGADYTSGNFLLPQYIWPNMLASNYGRTLLVSNFAVGSSRLSFTEANMESHFNTAGQLPVTWDGVAVAMGGWNDMGNETVNDTFLAILRRGYEAWIARLLIDNYGGISYVGWTRTGTGDEKLLNWSTTGDNNQPSVTATNASKLPFWRTDFGSPYGQTRWRTRMTADEVTSFTITTAKSLGLFFDTSIQGGTFNVTNNGEYVGTYSTHYDSTYTFPLVVWMEDVPATNNIIITSLTGTNYFLAAGWVTPKTVAPSRTVIMAGMTANTASSRNITNLWKCNKAMESAVSAFSDRHPVYFANVFNSYVQATDQETGGGDISHFTPTGNLHISESFARAYRPTGASSSNVASVVELVGQASISYVNASTNGFATTTFANSVTNNAALMRTDANNIVTGSNYVQGLNLGGTWRTTWPSSGTNASTVFVGGVSVDAPNFSNGTHVAFAVADSTNVSATLSGVAFAESNNVLHGSLLLTNTLDDAAVPLIIGAHDIQNANLLEVYTSGAGAPGFAVTAGAELHGNATGLTNFSGNVGAWGGLTTNTLSSIWIDAGAMRTNSAGGPSVFYLLATNNLAPCLDAWAFDSTTPETNYFSLRMPDQYDLSTVKLKLYYFDTTYATDKTNVWGVCAYATSLGDLFGTTGTEYFVTNGVLDTTNKLNIATTPAITIGGTPALGDLIHFRIRRVADNATDDAAGDSLLIGAALQYGDKRNNPAAW